MSSPSAPELGKDAHVISFVADQDKGKGGGKGSNNSSRRSLSGAGGDDDLAMQHSISGGENIAGDALGRSTRQPSYWSVSDMSFTPLETAESQAVLTWKHLTVRSKRDPSKQLLKDVSGSITGGFWSLMGPSGSGKSTLVNTLACRLTPGMWFEGEIRMNGRVYSLSDLKCMSGYVMQDDLMNGALTVEETLFYAGELRLPRDMTKAHRAERIKESIVEMGIDHVRNVVVGDALHKGISGGERKRLAVAMELLTHPQLLFLDEPTSGKWRLFSFSFSTPSLQFVLFLPFPPHCFCVPFFLFRLLPRAYKCLILSPSVTQNLRS